MSEKVIVNKVVAGWIEEEKKCCGDDAFWLLYEVLGKRTNSEYENIDIVTLAKAIQYGYEVPYEFKEGDIAININREVIEVVARQTNGFERSVEYMNENRELFKLVCKAENREDLK